MEKEKSIIKVTYEENSDGNGYKEKRDYDGSFGKLQLLRTMVGLYNDVILGHHHQDDKLSLQELKLLGDNIEKLLEQGEKQNAN